MQCFSYGCVRICNQVSLIRPSGSRKLPCTAWTAKPISNLHDQCMNLYRGYKTTEGSSFASCLRLLKQGICQPPGILQFVAWSCILHGGHKLGPGTSAMGGSSTWKGAIAEKNLLHALEAALVNSDLQKNLPRESQHVDLLTSKEASQQVTQLHTIYDFGPFLSTPVECTFQQSYIIILSMSTQK